VTILGDLILYRDRIIYFEIRSMEVEIEGRYVVISFNVLLLRKDKAVLGILFL